jgi:hypothetical protein
VKNILERIKNEPALLIGFISAVISLALAFGFTLSEEQIGGIMAVVVAILALVTRNQVVAFRRVESYQTVQGETVTGPAAPPEGRPAETVATGPVDISELDRLDGIRHPEEGAVDTGILVALACIVVIICGIVWLVQTL